MSIWIASLGGLFLCYLGIRTFLAAPAEQAAELRSVAEKVLIGKWMPDCSEVAGDWFI